jgi:hypothetical protein
MSGIDSDGSGGKEGEQSLNMKQQFTGCIEMMMASASAQGQLEEVPSNSRWMAAMERWKQR